MDHVCGQVLKLLMLLNCLAFSNVILFNRVSIHKPCTDSCGGLRIEPVTIEKHIDLAFPIFERILFFLQSLFFS